MIATQTLPHTVQEVT